MALLDIQTLQKLSGKEAVPCPNCQGDLKRSELERGWQVWLRKLSFGILRIYKLKCTDCGKEFKLL